MGYGYALGSGILVGFELELDDLGGGMLRYGCGR